MSTLANLELRLANSTLRRSVTPNGYRVSRSLVDLAEIYYQNSNPSAKELREWFKRRAGEILPNSPSKSMVGGNDDIIIDPARRLVTFTGYGAYEPNDQTTYFAVRGAIQFLEQEHNYQFVTFSNPGVRKMERELQPPP